MTRSATLGLALLFASACAGPAPLERPAGPAPGFLSGRIVTLQGAPVPGASVWAEFPHQRDRHPAPVKTDAEGRFRLGPLPPTQSVHVWAEGIEVARERRLNVPVFAGTDADLGDFTLAPGSRVHGKVLDADRKPVRGATVTIRAVRHTLGHTIEYFGPAWSTLTGADGAYEILGLPTGEISMRITAPDLITAGHLGFSLGPPHKPVDAGARSLKPDAPISGVVVDQGGAAIPEARVYPCISFGGGDHPDYEQAVDADATGRFRLGGIGPEVVKVRVEAPGCTEITHKISGDRGEQRIVLRRSPAICGRVVDADTGAPVRFERVQLCEVERNKDGTISLSG